MIDAISQPSSDRAGVAAPVTSRLAVRPFAWPTVWLSHALWLLVPFTFAFAITNQSLWTDEGFTISFAAHRSFSSFLSALIGTRATPGDPQIALYLTYIWAWIKIFGQSEFALRAANIPFALIFVAATAWGARRLLGIPNLWALFCLSPFFWFYLNEARPYVALLAFSALATVALLAYLLEPQKYALSAAWFCLLGLLLACATHVMAIFLGISFLILASVLMLQDRPLRYRFIADWCKPILVFIPIFGLLAAFIAAVSANGVNNGRATPHLSGLLYALYEFTGFSGLGPPRGDIHAAQTLSIFPAYSPWLLFGLAPLLAIVFFLFRAKPSLLVIAGIAAVIIGVALPVAISFKQNFQILGRHLAIFFPLFFFLFLLWLKPLFDKASTRTAVLASLFLLCIVWTVSDLRLTHLDKYQKDCYRDAVAQSLALARANNEPVFWAADPQTALYYGLEVMNGSQSSAIAKPDALDRPINSQAIDARNWTAQQISTKIATSPGAILVLGNSEFFDLPGAWHAFIAREKPPSLVSPRGFALYELPQHSIPAH